MNRSLTMLDYDVKNRNFKGISAICKMCGLLVPTVLMCCSLNLKFSQKLLCLNVWYPPSDLVRVWNLWKWSLA